MSDKIKKINLDNNDIENTIVKFDDLKILGISDFKQIYYIIDSEIYYINLYNNYEKNKSLEKLIYFNDNRNGLLFVNNIINILSYNSNIDILSSDYVLNLSSNIIDNKYDLLENGIILNNINFSYLEILSNINFINNTLLFDDIYIEKELNVILRLDYLDYNSNILFKFNDKRYNLFENYINNLNLYSIIINNNLSNLDLINHLKLELDNDNKVINNENIFKGHNILNINYNFKKDNYYSNIDKLSNINLLINENVLKINENYSYLNIILNLNIDFGDEFIGSNTISIYDIRLNKIDIFNNEKGTYYIYSNNNPLSFNNNGLNLFNDLFINLLENNGIKENYYLINSNLDKIIDINYNILSFDKNDNDYIKSNIDLSIIYNDSNINIRNIPIIYLNDYTHNLFIINIGIVFKLNLNNIILFENNSNIYINNNEYIFENNIGIYVKDIRYNLINSNLEFTDGSNLNLLNNIIKYKNNYKYNKIIIKEIEYDSNVSFNNEIILTLNSENINYISNIDIQELSLIYNNYIYKNFNININIISIFNDDINMKLNIRDLRYSILNDEINSYTNTIIINENSINLLNILNDILKGNTIDENSILIDYNI